MSKLRAAGILISSRQTLHLAFPHLKRLLQEPQWFGSSQGLLRPVGSHAPDLDGGRQRNLDDDDDDDDDGDDDSGVDG